jgi:hypothetical protein
VNWEEALAAMKIGSKVRYSSWWWGRYIYIDQGQITYENGRIVDVDPWFPAGKLSWEIYDEERHGAHNENGNQRVQR